MILLDKRNEFYLLNFDNNLFSFIDMPLKLLLNKHNQTYIKFLNKFTNLKIKAKLALCIKHLYLDFLNTFLKFL